MEVPLQPDKEARLAQIAAQKGLNADELAQQVISSYLEDDTRFVEAVNLGLAAAQRGDFVDHDNVGKKLEQIARLMRQRWTTPADVTPVDGAATTNAPRPA
jgi:predicted transcriptional regulator